MHERSIFLAALEIPDLHRRADFVANACGNDMSLRSQIEDLLKAHEQPRGFMQRPAPALVSTIDGQLKGPALARHFLPIFREGLLRLYEETGQREQAAKLRKEIAEQIEPREK